MAKRQAPPASEEFRASSGPATPWRSSSRRRHRSWRRAACAFTTNAVAERAGVSIGTLYQYFANKDVLIVALARQEVRNGLQSVGRAMQGDPELGTSVEGRVRAVVRAMVRAFRDRPRARKAVTEAILARNLGQEMLGEMAVFINQQSGVLVGELSREQLFVMSRALMGAVRSAVMEEQPFLRSRAFMLLSPLGERLGEGVMQETIFAFNPLT